MQKTIVLLWVCIVFTSCGVSLKGVDFALDKDVVKIDPLVKGTAEFAISRMERLDSIQISKGEYAPMKTFSQAQYDSLYRELLDKKEIMLDITFKRFYDLLLATNLNDTTYLTNIYLKTPNDGAPVSYEYDVKRNDLVFYSIENMGRNRIEEVSILEGGSYRFIEQKFKGKDSKQGSIKIMDDNTMTLNVSNDEFFKNKGFFGSKLKISLKKVSPIKIKYEEVLDSILITTKSIEIIKDTLFTSSYDEELFLKPILDITKTNKISIPVNIEIEDKQLVGWGYWIGLNKSNQLLWMDDQDNELNRFAYQEFFNKDEAIVLETSENENIKLKINNISLDTRTLNYANNYAFYRTDEKIQKTNRKAEIVIENLSSVYTYTIQLGLVSVFFKEREVELDREKYLVRKYFKLSIVEDE